MTVVLSLLIGGCGLLKSGMVSSFFVILVGSVTTLQRRVVHSGQLLLRVQFFSEVILPLHPSEAFMLADGSNFDGRADCRGTGGEAGESYSDINHELCEVNRILQRHGWQDEWDLQGLLNHVHHLPQLCLWHLEIVYQDTDHPSTRTHDETVEGFRFASPCRSRLFTLPQEAWAIADAVLDVNLELIG